MAGPLAGYTVLDLTSMISGPTATMMLADQGAEVIKVENPRGGDHTRQVSTGRNGFSAAFVNNNRNKRSLTLDLKHPAGVAALKRLAATADVLVQNFRPGVVERIGVGEAAIREVAPRIIYVSISGFGEAGPFAQKPVYDPLVQALSGLTTVQAGSNEARPRLVRTILPDKLTGYAAAQAITAALLARERTGTGQHVRLSMLDTMVSFLWGSDMGAHTFVGNELGTEKAQSFIDLIYQTSDGFITVAVQSDKEWAALCRAFDKREWLNDPRFATTVMRSANIDERLQMTQDVLLTDTSTNWLERLEREDVPCAPVLTRAEVIRHPQIAANGSIGEFHHPVAGQLRQALPAPRFSHMEFADPQPAPGLGQHTIDILAESGFSAHEIEELSGLGALGEGFGE